MFLFGVAITLNFKLVCNFIFCLAFSIIASKDNGYSEYSKKNTGKVWAFLITSFLLSVNLYKFLAAKFIGRDQMKITYANS